MPVPPGFSAVVFLSHVNAPGMPLFPGDPPFRLRPVATVAADGYLVHAVEIGEQSGTHWASAGHFNAGQPLADEMAADRFFHPAAVLDVRGRVRGDEDFELSVQEVLAFERTHGRIADDSVVIMWTGFAERWSDPDAYVNADAEGVRHSPGFGEEVTGWLIDQRAIGGLGIDTLGVDPGRDTEFRANTVLLHGNRIHLENLTGLEHLPPFGGWVVAGGMRNAGGSGSPATVFGLLP